MTFADRPDDILDEACRALDAAEIRVDRAARAVEDIAKNDDRIEALVNSLIPPPPPTAVVDSERAKK